MAESLEFAELSPEQLQDVTEAITDTLIMVADKNTITGSADWDMAVILGGVLFVVLTGMGGILWALLEKRQNRTEKKIEDMWNFFTKKFNELSTSNDEKFEELKESSSSRFEVIREAQCSYKESHAKKFESLKDSNNDNQAILLEKINELSQDTLRSSITCQAGFHEKINGIDKKQGELEIKWDSFIKRSGEKLVSQA